MPLISQLAKYAVAVLPGASWLLAVALSPAVPSMYDSSTPFRVVGPLLLLLVLAGAIVSAPVVVIAVRRLWHGKDLWWVVVSLLFSLPVFVLSAIALLGLATHAKASGV